MRLFLSFSVVAVLVSSLAFAQTVPVKADRNSEEEQQLVNRDQEWNEAYKNRDEKALRDLLADDFVFADEEGQVWNKDQYIRDIVTKIKVESYTIDEVTARVYGETGVVVIRWKGRLTYDGKDAGGVFRCIGVFVKRQGRWVVVASQDTRLPK